LRYEKPSSDTGENYLRTGAYIEIDGRNVWSLAKVVEDLTTHPATRAMVDYYAGWHDRHCDPEWHNMLLTTPDANGERTPVAFCVPQTADDLRRIGRSFAVTIFPSAGNVSHTPAYGHLIALGILEAVQRRNPAPDHVAIATKYRDWLAETGRFLTFSSGGATIGYRFRDEPIDQASLRLVNETDAGIVVSGKVGMHTSVPFAEDATRRWWGGYVGVSGRRSWSRWQRLA
jgi:4-hydroxyphenylacetate 3-monooxygenase